MRRKKLGKGLGKGLPLEGPLEFSAQPTESWGRSLAILIEAMLFTNVADEPRRGHDVMEANRESDKQYYVRWHQ